MQSDFDNNLAVSAQLPNEKKKIIVAVCLVLLMGLMWFRMLTKEGPASAEAVELTTEMKQVSGDIAGAVAEIVFFQLPIETGRNDMLQRDFFSAENWSLFAKDKQRWQGLSKNQNNQSQSQGNVSEFEQRIKDVADKINLQAIGTGLTPEVFMNDSLFSIGESIVVQDGENNFTFKIVKITKNAVTLNSNGITVTRKLSHLDK